ncbi:MAG: hypothetical protein BIP78_0794 [Candidatus Bipolaricaulis sibiricus]|uniref:OB domain-containing protein n=1 Tax=Bipolaricaulis sibiricus TaxID=2501609 RepID=A0A410FUH8_BIPS1|nr:MAG: hypothetical protein BIP78_0794 [Candidatus Bipolaricaulis sibiricus]
MNTKAGWVLIVAAIVLAGLGAAVGLGVFRGTDRIQHPPSGSPAVAALSPTAATAVGAVTTGPAGQTPGESAALQPHVERERQAEWEESESPQAVGSVTDAALPEDSAALARRPDGPVALRVAELIAAAAQHAGQEVILTGRILTLCVRGCQLSLDDGTGVIPVELVDDALTNTVPLRSIGRQIEVIGVFRLTPRPHVAVERPEGWRFP